MNTVERNLYRMMVCMFISIVLIVNAVTISHPYYFLTAVIFAAIGAAFALRANKQFVVKLSNKRP